MYMCHVHTLAPHKRTSLGTPPRPTEGSVVVATAAAAAPLPPAIEPWPSLGMVAKIERPERVGVGSTQHVDTGLDGQEGC